MTSTQPSDRDRVITAFNHAITQLDSEAGRFGLRLVPEGLAEVYGGWVVPVASGVPGGSARELTRTLDRVGEIIEKETNLDISVLLDPSEFRSDNSSKKAS